MIRGWVWRGTWMLVIPKRLSSPRSRALGFRCPGSFTYLAAGGGFGPGEKMIVVTGATGNTGRPAVEALLASGEKVRVIGRDAKKLEPFTQKGAEAFVGNAEDAQQMSKAFLGATAVYLLIPQADHEDFRAYQDAVSDAYWKAVSGARVPYAVTLSSLGAQHPEKTGPIVGLYHLEQKMNSVPGLNVLHLRPGPFMENLFMGMVPLRTMGFLPGGT